MNQESYLFTVPKNHRRKIFKYPVIYLFDAESLFFTTVGAVKFLNYSSHLPQMPEAYIVGIVNTNRDRDMPIPQEIEKNNGAEHFYQFLSKELIPYINKNYSTTDLNILVGHSQGALFANYAAFHNPKLFPFVISMDVPMDVTKSVEQNYLQKLVGNCGIKYISTESKFGWRESFKQDSNCPNHSQLIIEGESHETMPYKSIYDGLKFLFNDYIPPVKDWPLQKLTDYYKTLQKKYQVSYPAPSKVLLESARQNIGQSKKTTAVELIEENDRLYGTSEASQRLFAKANAITNKSDDRLAYHLSHPSPSDEAIKPFLGKWHGVLVVPDGDNMDIDWEIKKVNEKYQMESDVMKQFKTMSDFLYINERNELVWGRKHDAGGIYLSIGVLSKDGKTITGTEDLIGHMYPSGVPIAPKNSFEFKKL